MSVCRKCGVTIPDFQDQYCADQEACGRRRDQQREVIRKVVESTPLAITEMERNAVKQAVECEQNGDEVLWEGSYGGVPVRLLVTASGAEVSEYQRYDGQGWVVYPTPHYDHLPHHLARLLHAATSENAALAERARVTEAKVKAANDAFIEVEHAKVFAEKRLREVEQAARALLDAADKVNSVDCASGNKRRDLWDAMDTMRAALAAEQPAETPERDDRAAPDDGPFCMATNGVMLCTLPPGHDGDEHVAHGAGNIVRARWPLAPPPSDNERIAILEHQVKTLHETLGTLISWIAQSAVSPLSLDNASELLRHLAKADRRGESHEETTP